jgi:hypothetical protein
MFVTPEARISLKLECSNFTHIGLRRSIHTTPIITASTTRWVIMHASSTQSFCLLSLLFELGSDGPNNYISRTLSESSCNWFGP